ncbi:MAG: hypothetical protein HGA76_10910, partial [Candidatus Firestonebacteria bacterium]|nr:hypothetical protein [Candidatus Firestonebacteria bacterium]
IPGVGPKTAEKILAVVESYFPPVEASKKATTAAELFASLGGETLDKTKEEKVMAARDLFAGLDQAAAGSAGPVGEIEESEERAADAEAQPGNGAAAAEAEPEAKAPRARGRKKAAPPA